MKLDGGQAKQRSYMGACLTVFAILVTSVFAYYKLLTLSEYLDVDVMYANVESGIHHTEKFNSDNGFFVAAALTAYDLDNTVTEDPKYGEL